MPLKQPAPSRRTTGTMLQGIAETIYPQKLYTLGLDELTERGLDRARPTGWRFTGKLTDSDVSVDVVPPGRGKAAAVTQLRYGGHITSARDAIRAVVAKLDKPDARDFELRLLEVPALGVHAVWLRSRDGGQDLFIPCLPAAGLKSMKHYTRAQFLKALVPGVKRRLSFDDAPRKVRRPRQSGGKP